MNSDFTDLLSPVVNKSFSLLTYLPEFVVIWAFSLKKKSFTFVVFTYIYTYVSVSSVAIEVEKRVQASGAGVPGSCRPLSRVWVLRSKHGSST